MRTAQCNAATTAPVSGVRRGEGCREIRTPWRARRPGRLIPLLTTTPYRDPTLALYTATRRPTPFLSYPHHSPLCYLPHLLHGFHLQSSHGLSAPPFGCPANKARFRWRLLLRTGIEPDGDAFGGPHCFEADCTPHTQYCRSGTHGLWAARIVQLRGGGDRSPPEIPPPFQKRLT